MANELYWRQLTEAGPATIGPNVATGANDGWAVVARYPRRLLPQSATQRLAVFVKGTIGEVSWSGPGPVQRGIVQVCLGLDQGNGAGLKGLTHRCNLPLDGLANDVPQQFDGIQFGFLMVQQKGDGVARPAISDPDFGPYLDTFALTDDLCLWARVARNGDPGLYVANATIADVQWLVFDMDALEANGHVRAIVDTSFRTLSGSVSKLHDDPNDLGAQGDRWMHLTSINYRVTDRGVAGPLFRWGHSTDGTFGPASGMTYEQDIGQNRAAIAASGLVEKPRQAQPCLWWDDRPAAGRRTTLTGYDRHGLGAIAATEVNHTASLSFKIDEMDDANFYAGPSFMSGECPTFSSPNEPEAYVPLERQANYGGRTLTTCFFAMHWGSGHPASTVPGTESAQLRIVDSENQFIHVPGSFVWVNGIAPHFDIVQLISFKDLPLPPSVARQFRAKCIVRTSNVQPSNALRPSLSMAFGLYAPSNTNDPPWTEPNPVVLQIGREGALPLNTLSPAPDTVSTVNTDGYKFGEVVGRTGYKRTWPTWLKPRRTYQFKWEPIADEALDNLEAFLAANVQFSYQPQGTSTALNFALSGPLEIERLGDGRSIVRVTAVELVWVL